MTTILVTGGTGTLGRPTVEKLRAAGHDVRVLSRRGGEGRTRGELLTGEGIPEALAGVDTVVHLATHQRKDVALARTVLEHASGIRHLVLVSIVGVDQIPLPYYKGKVEIERLVAASGVPHTIQRITQFHDFVDMFLRVQRFSPVILAPSFRLQPIDVRDAADRLVELCEADAAGRAPDIGGPEQRAVRELAIAWKEARGSRRPVVPLRLPGRTFAAYGAGHQLVPGPAFGTTVFEEFLARKYGG